MTRKRFVKLLMSKGYDRNGANGIANKTQEDGYSYENAYLLITDIPDLIDRLWPNIVNLAETVSKLITALGAGFAAFGEAYKDAMEED